ncbi:MAG: hypothetical protein AB1486_21700 [Planctomycetota bacterium]
MLTILILSGVMAQGIAGNEAPNIDLEAVAKQAMSMGSYSFVVQSRVDGAPSRDERLDTITGHMARGKPLHLVQGKLEVFCRDEVLALREDGGNWTRMNFTNPFMQPGTAKTLTARGEEAEGAPARDRFARGAAAPGSVFEGLQARVEAVQLRQVTPPHEFLGTVAQTLEGVEIKGAENGMTVITGKLTKEATRNYQPGMVSGGRARFRTRGAPEWDTDAQVRILVGKDGYVRRYDVVVRFVGSVGEQAFDQTRTQSIEISKVNATEVEVPQAAAELLAD